MNDSTLQSTDPAAEQSNGSVLFWTLGALSIVAVSLGAGVASAWWHGGLELADAGPGVSLESAGPPPAGFPAGDAAEPVPGLEAVRPVFGITLCADRLTCVLVTEQNPATKHDLYLTQRSSPTDPFGPLQPLYTCNSPERDTLPTLSPSGDRLLFVRQGNQASKRGQVQA